MISKVGTGVLDGPLSGIIATSYGDTPHNGQSRTPVPTVYYVTPVPANTVGSTSFSMEKIGLRVCLLSSPKQHQQGNLPNNTHEGDGVEIPMLRFVAKELHSKECACAASEEGNA